MASFDFYDWSDAMACSSEIKIIRKHRIDGFTRTAFLEHAKMQEDEWSEFIASFNSGKTALFQIVQNDMQLAAFNLEITGSTLWGGWAGGGGHAIGLWGRLDSWLIQEAKYRGCSEIGLLSKRRGVYRILQKQGYEVVLHDDTWHFKKRV